MEDYYTGKHLEITDTFSYGKVEHIHFPHEVLKPSS